MKTKHIATATVVALASTSSMAQSSVQLFGVADIGFQHASQGGKSISQMTSSGNNPSSLGFRGVEQLGGNMYAGFWLESSLDLTKGSGPGGAPVSYNRRSTLDFGGDFGTIRLGREVVPSYWNITLNDPFHTLGSGSNNPLTELRMDRPNSGGKSPGVRANNSISYLLNVNKNEHSAARGVRGISLQLMHAFGERSENGPALDRYSGMRIAYANGPLNIGVAYGTAVVSATAKSKIYNLGGSYNFGAVNLMGSIGVNDQGAPNNKNTYWQIGAKIPLGNGYIPISYVSSKLNNAAGAKATLLAVGYVYDMSKRTSVYTTVALVGNKNGSAVTFAGGNGGFSTRGAGLASANSSARGFDIGLRHRF